MLAFNLALGYNRYMKNTNNEIWLTRQHFNTSKKVGVSKKRTFASGLFSSMNQAQSELEEICGK